MASRAASSSSPLPSFPETRRTGRGLKAPPRSAAPAAFTCGHLHDLFLLDKHGPAIANLAATDGQTAGRHDGQIASRFAAGDLYGARMGMTFSTSGLEFGLNAVALGLIAANCAFDPDNDMRFHSQFFDRRIIRSIILDKGFHHDNHGRPQD